jgi:flagellar biosynthetic protein FliQ
VESQVLGIAINAMKVTMILSFPALLVAMVIGLLISIFQATTQINEMTLSFVPKLIGIAVVVVLTAPWAMTTLIDFTTRLFKMIPTFIQ